MNRQLTLHFVALIPVGHRVEVTRYEHHEQKTFFSAATSKQGYTARDLDTGIFYSPGWIHDINRPGSDEFYFHERLAEGVVKAGSFKAQVVACTLVSKQGNANNHRLITFLTIRPLL